LSEIRANTVSDAAGTGPVTLTGQYAAKAWVNFNGTGTVAIRQSGNVSSITDNGTGNYTVNFTTAMVDANYGFCTTLGNTPADCSSIVTSISAGSIVQYSYRIPLGIFIDCSDATTLITR
jgi:hypothetical protein